MLATLDSKQQHVYSHGQKFTYTCKEHVYDGSLEFQRFVKLTCDGMSGTLLCHKKNHDF